MNIRLGVKWPLMNEAGADGGDAGGSGAGVASTSDAGGVNITVPYGGISNWYVAQFAIGLFSCARVRAFFVLAKIVLHLLPFKKRTFSHVAA